MEKEIQIPDGFEAKIEGNKVFFVPKESEDERIRKMLIERVRTAEELTETLREWIISYLEKQKEQKPAEWSEEDEKMIDTIICDLERHGGKDDSIFSSIYSKEVSWLKDVKERFKSLRPHPRWKPSEEQMEVFLKAIPVNLMPEELTIYHSLCNDLKKL